MTHTKKSLAATGHDALCNLDANCGCRVGDLYPCCEKTDCVPAHWHRCDRCGREGAYLDDEQTICDNCDGCEDE